jgi:DNA invertase Pin-like site-specific DNA recombinase
VDKRGTTMIKCGYVRVSREDQNPENQIELLEREGIPRENIYVDKISGVSDARDRPGYSDLLSFLSDKPEAVLYVFEISRIGRSFLDTLQTINLLERAGVRVWSLSPSESWSRIEDRKLRDLMLSIFSWVADRERESLIERTKLGLVRAKAEGKQLGRPVRKIPTARVKELRDKKISLAAISRILDIPYSTLRRNYKE